jgi:hypothetical protein
MKADLRISIKDYNRNKNSKSNWFRKRILSDRVTGDESQRDKSAREFFIKLSISWTAFPSPVPTAQF